MTKDRKFKFRFLIVTDNYTFVDQQVHSYIFINIGSCYATINNNYKLNFQKNPAISGIPNSTYVEPLLAGEKTAQEYKLIFDPTSQPVDRAVQVIMKIEVLDGK